MSTFQAWPKIPRWNREVVITEKIDGTNAAIIITPWAELVQDVSDGYNWSEDYYRKYGASRKELLAIVGDPIDCEYEGSTWIEYRSDAYAVFAQSRSRLIYPGADNFGFAGWVQEDAVALVNLLGPGRHFGEWYGKGIQRNYGLDHKRFALFNVHRWSNEDTLGSGLPIDVVPVLATLGSPSEMDRCDLVLDDVLYELEQKGSSLVPGFDKPEGIVLYHTAAKQTFKILIEGDDAPKGQAA